MIEILNVVDSSNAKYYEVDYLAQDRILKEIHYSNDSNRDNAYDQGLDTGEFSVDVSVPYTLEYIKTNYYQNLLFSKSIIIKLTNKLLIFYFLINTN